MLRALVLSTVLAASTLFASAPAQAFGPLCQRYANQPLFTRAIQTVATNMQYTPAQLCSLERILDIQVTHTNLVDENQNPIPHTWVTLHYNEYSCQYFVRDADQVTTKKNCYNTY